MKENGYYIFEPLMPNGDSRGRYGPYSLKFMRDFLRNMLDAKDWSQLARAIEITQKEPGQAFDLTDFREINGQEVLHWSARLTWFKVEVLPFAIRR